MRWGDEVKSMEDLDLPKTGSKNMRPNASELKMAKMLVQDMSGHWDPDDFKDEFKRAVMELVDKKVKAGKTEAVVEPQEEAPGYTDNIIDLTDLLKRSLRGGGKGRATAAHDDADDKAVRKSGARKAAPRKTTAKGAAKKAAGRKTAAKTAGHSRKAA
jgi:DNA end-binding protein Ku